MLRLSAHCFLRVLVPFQSEFAPPCAALSPGMLLRTQVQTLRHTRQCSLSLNKRKIEAKNDKENEYEKTKQMVVVDVSKTIDVKQISLRPEQVSITTIYHYRHRPNFAAKVILEQSVYPFRFVLLRFC